MPTPATGRQIGRYVLFGEIASGGMATVHFGRLSGPAGFSRTVAIKKLHPQFSKDPEFVAMFLDEARLAARIRHPNVVPTLDVVATDGEVFLVMEYVQGESLARLLRSVRAIMAPADTRVIATIMAGVAHGLHAAHEAKDEQGVALDIVHRDVSPQNVLVGVDGIPHILDFGVAKAAGRIQTTREGQLKGKLSYMAPEQLHGSMVTRQTDVYAAAVVAWEAVTGQKLFQGDSEAAVVTAILQRPVKPPSEAASHVPLGFDRVVMRGLERDPARRYATAREMAIELERCVGVASASEVGSWVEGLAHDELLKRASRIAEIESVSSPGARERPKSLPSIGEMPTTVTETAVEPSSQRPKDQLAEVRSDISSIAVSPILPVAPRRAPSRFALMATTASVVAALMILLGLMFGLRPSRSPTSTAAAPPLPAVDVPVAPTTSTPPPTTSDEGVVPPPVESIASAPPSAKAARQQMYPRSLGPAPRFEPKRAPFADCDPPFTIDAVGHKHYKPACLQ
jgi:serine/threonine-protein kinase